MAIDRKARKPTISVLQLRFVRFSGHALTQGVVNMKIDGESIRVYGKAKTLVDCLTYGRKVGMGLGVEALRQGILQEKCSLERLPHFAKIRGVEKLLRDAYSLTFNMAAKKEI